MEASSLLNAPHGKDIDMKDRLHLWGAGGAGRRTPSLHMSGVHAVSRTHRSGTLPRATSVPKWSCLLSPWDARVPVPLPPRPPARAAAGVLGFFVVGRRFLAHRRCDFTDDGMGIQW